MRLRQLRCSFCLKRDDRVAKLVAGRRGYICDRCAAAAMRIMEESPAPPAGSSSRSLFATIAERWRRLIARREAAEALP